MIDSCLPGCDSRSRKRCARYAVRQWRHQQRTLSPSSVVLLQVQSSALNMGSIPVDPTAMLAGTPPGPSTFARPIGGFMNGGNEVYQERDFVVTREKVVSLGVGTGVTLALPLAEPADGILNGPNSLYLRAECLQ